MTGKYVRPETKTAAKVTQVACPQCGGALTLRAKGYTQTLVCQYCFSVLDVDKTNVSISSRRKTTLEIEPLIPLGSRGKLHGVIWEVIGFMQRRGIYSPFDQQKPATPAWKSVAFSLITDNDDDDNEPPPEPITWQEYLLFNPLKGFRWLSERNGHWNYIITLHDIPTKEYWNENRKYLDTSYRFYETYQATVLFVIGEFYWRLKTGDKHKITDFLNKSAILSLEESNKVSEVYPHTVGQASPIDSLLMGGSDTQAEVKPRPIYDKTSTDAEQIWSLAEYIEPEEIQTAFNLEYPLPARTGVAINQPVLHQDIIQNAYKTSGLGLATLIILQMAFAVFSPAQHKLISTELIVSKPVPQTNIFGANPVTPETTNKYVSAPFTINHSFGVMTLTMQASVNQSWVEVDFNLIDDATGKSINIDSGLEYYSGYSSDGYWAEGKRSDTWTFSVPPKGQYHLVMTGETNHNEPLSVFVELSQGSTSVSNFILALILILLPGAMGLFYTLFFEARREQ